MESHAAALFPLLSDQALWEFTDHAPPESLDALRGRYRRLESRRSPDGTQLWLNWAIFLHDGTVVGLVQATVAPDHSAAEIAYVLGRPYWSRGLAQEAVSAMLAALEESLGAVSFVATVDSRNVASARLLTRLGFVVTDSSDPQNVRWRRK